MVHLKSGHTPHLQELAAGLQRSKRRYGAGQGARFEAHCALTQLRVVCLFRLLFVSVALLFFPREGKLPSCMRTLALELYASMLCFFNLRHMYTALWLYIQYRDKKVME